MMKGREGRRLGRYRLVRELGRGGMGVVYEARHIDLDTRVAIKVMTGLGDAAARAIREGRAAVRLDHPNVVKILDVGEDDGAGYLVMELLDGEDLAAKLAREGALTLETITAIMLPVLSAVSAGHAAGVLHRDLKPSNIFLTTGANGQVVPKVVDFGISKVDDPTPTGRTRTQSHALLGTVEYLSPEQVRDPRRASTLSDQYALGVVLYECLTGGTPFWGEDRYELLQAVMSADLVPPRRLNPDVSREVDAVVCRALSRDPDKRFPSVAALSAAVVHAAKSQTATAGSPERQRPAKSMRRTGWILSISALSISGIAITAKRISRSEAGGIAITAAPSSAATDSVQSCGDTRSDPDNCGSCGRRCVDDRRCFDGVCANAPVQVASDPHGFTTCARLANGTVYCWGANEWRQVGNGDVTSPCVNTAARVTTDVNGKPFDDVTSIAVDHNHACALTRARDLYCWGRNELGQLGLGISRTVTTRPQRVPGVAPRLVAASGDRTCVVDDEGHVACWGTNVDGSLGHTSGTQGDVRCDGGQLWCNEKQSQIPGLHDVTALSLGFEHACALDSLGVTCWGRDDAGQLGDGIRPRTSAFNAARLDLGGVAGLTSGANFTCAWSAAPGPAWCWGANGHGQLAQSNSVEHVTRTRFDAKGHINDVVGGAGGAETALVLRSDGSIFASGYNLDGEVGNGTRGGSNYCEPKHELACVNTARLVVAPSGEGPLLAGQVTAGYRHGCAIGRDDAIYCWGTGACGVLGDGRDTSSSVPRKVEGLPLSYLSQTSDP